MRTPKQKPHAGGRGVSSSAQRSVQPTVDNCTPIVPLRGARCKCAGCGKCFASERIFSAHRRGDFAVKRFCLSEQELLQIGIVRSVSGLFIQQRSKATQIALGAHRTSNIVPAPLRPPSGPLLR
jgi:hypothetical protein